MDLKEQSEIFDMRLYQLHRTTNDYFDMMHRIYVNKEGSLNQIIFSNLNPRYLLTKEVLSSIAPNHFKTECKKSYDQYCRFAKSLLKKK